MKLLIICIVFFVAQSYGDQPPESRIASLFVSQDLINNQLTSHVKNALVKDLKVTLDPKGAQFFLLGTVHVPVEELRAVNLDPSYGVFKFQVTVKPEITKKGYLILEFPLSQTFFYPAHSKHPSQERVIIPVQLLSLALASVRGYLAALSGDFSGFDRRTKTLSAQMAELSHLIINEKNSEIKEGLENQRESVRLQIAAIPIERKQLMALSKEVEHLLGFTGEKELNLNDELGARRNALVFKVKLSQFAPYLKGAEFGGIRLLHDKKDGEGQDYLALDINSTVTSPLPPRINLNPSTRAGMKTPPALIIRLNQALFESESLIDAEQKEGSSKIRNLDIQLKDDGLHVAGGWKTFFFTVPFDTVVDFVSTGTDIFEIRVREMKVAGLDLEFLTKFVLESIKKRLDHALGGVCIFSYKGEEADRSRALQVAIKAKALVPAFPDLHLVAIDVRDREFLLKIGQP